MLACQLSLNSLSSLSQSNIGTNPTSSGPGLAPSSASQTDTLHIRLRPRLRLRLSRFGMRLGGRLRIGRLRACRAPRTRRPRTCRLHTCRAHTCHPRTCRWRMARGLRTCSLHTAHLADDLADDLARRTPQPCALGRDLRDDRRPPSIPRRTMSQMHARREVAGDGGRWREITCGPYRVVQRSVRPRRMRGRAPVRVRVRVRAVVGVPRGAVVGVPWAVRAQPLTRAAALAARVNLMPPRGHQSLIGTMKSSSSYQGVLQGTIKEPSRNHQRVLKALCLPERTWLRPQEPRQHKRKHAYGR